MVNDPIDRVCEPSRCTGCGACVVACPFNAIAMTIDDEGFPVPCVSQNLCVGCKACVQVCPSCNGVQGFEADFYMAWNRSLFVLDECSSGGVFDGISSWTFEHGGVVFGVEMDSSTRELHHVMAEDPTELDNLRKSKYYQSDTLDAYERALGFLKEGRTVLFTGTACQIAGINGLVSKKHLDNNLITMDVLCHGVTSKRVIDAYIESREKEVGFPVVDISFRNKKTDKGWQDGFSSITTTTHACPGGYKEVIDSENLRGTFFSGFNRNLFLRESCYRCQYCGTTRIADFTAADFWGVPDELVSSEQCRRGVSLLLVNTEKGRAILPELGKWLHIEPTDRELAIPHNKSLVSPSARPALRDRFFGDLETMEFNQIIRKYYRKEMTLDSIKRFGRRLLGDSVYGLLKRVLQR